MAQVTASGCARYGGIAVCCAPRCVEAYTCTFRTLACSRRFHVGGCRLSTGPSQAIRVTRELAGQFNSMGRLFTLVSVYSGTWLARVHPRGSKAASGRCLVLKFKARPCHTSILPMLQTCQTCQRHPSNLRAPNDKPFNPA